MRYLTKLRPIMPSPPSTRTATGAADIVPSLLFAVSVATCTARRTWKSAHRKTSNDASARHSQELCASIVLEKSHSVHSVSHVESGETKRRKRQTNLETPMGGTRTEREFTSMSKNSHRRDE